MCGPFPWTQTRLISISKKDSKIMVCNPDLARGSNLVRVKFFVMLCLPMLFWFWLSVEFLCVVVVVVLVVSVVVVVVVCC